MQDEELHIDEDIKAAIGSAFDSGNVVTVGYVGDDRWPRLYAAGHRTSSRLATSRSLGS